MPQAQLQVINGQVFVCTPVVPNFTGHCESVPLKFRIDHMIRAVKRRMEECMEKLATAQAKCIIDNIQYNDGYSIIMFADGEAFNTASYDAMRSLLQKLEANKDMDILDCYQMSELLTFPEADQLFKAWIGAGYGWCNRTTQLDFLRYDLKNK